MSKTLCVDVHANNSYTANGSPTDPFTSIMAAVNQVIANGDNSSSIPYEINIGAGTYNETVDIGNIKIVNLTFNGQDGTQLTNGGNCFQSLTNNNTQEKIYFSNIIFNGGVQLANITNGGDTALYQFLFHNCSFVNSLCFQCSNMNYLTFYTCSFQGDISVTNTSQVYMQGCAGFSFGYTTGLTIITDNSLPMPSGLIKSGTYVNFKNTLMPVPISIDAGSELDAADGSDLGGVGLTISLYGVLHATLSTLLSNLTVQSTGNYIAESSSTSGTTTIIAGGTYTPLGLMQAESFQVGQQQKILGGSGTPEGAVTANVGSIYLRADGSVGATLYVKESGTGNTGWVAF